jgi:two-component system, response regulator
MMKTLPARILIVEDNTDDEALLMRQLSKADLHTQVKVIPDGGKAVDYLSREEHAATLVAVFLDLDLPTLRGVELLKYIRSFERTRHIPVILMTSSNSPGEIEQCRELGISSFVQKPVTFASFAKSIVDALHQP